MRESRGNSNWMGRFHNGNEDKAGGKARADIFARGAAGRSVDEPCWERLGGRGVTGQGPRYIIPPNFLISSLTKDDSGMNWLSLAISARPEVID